MEAKIAMLFFGFSLVNSQAEITVLENTRFPSSGLKSVAEFSSEDGDIMFIQNGGVYPRLYTASQHRKCRYLS
jgi:hypothetical protein